jgi:putative transposase
MRGKRFSDEQIIAVLKEVESGLPVKDVCRKYGVCENTYYNWKAKFSGMDASDVKRLRHLEEENRRLKQIVADQMLDIHALKGVLGKK